jgi:phospholipase C
VSHAFTSKLVAMTSLSRLVLALTLFAAILLLPSCQGVGTTSTTTTSTSSYALNVTVPNSGGVVKSNPAGISCPGTCSASFTAGAKVVLTATPSTNYFFGGWSGGCTGTSTCSVTLNATTKVSAAFNAGDGLTVAVTGSGTVTSNPKGINCPTTCSAEFPANTQVTLTAAAATGQYFTGWSGGSCTGTSTCVVTISGATNVSAAFNGAVALTIALAGQGTGTVTSTPPGINCSAGSNTGCTASFPPNTQVMLSETPATNDIFNGWTGACTGTGTCSLTLSAAASTTATFSLPGTIASINHIIFFAQENRSFDHYFGYLRQYWANTGIPDQSFDGLPQFNPTTGAAPLQGPVPTMPPCTDPAPSDCAANTSAPPSQWVPSFHMQSVCTEELSPFWNEAHVDWNFGFNYPNTVNWLSDGWVEAAANDARQYPLNFNGGQPVNDVNGYRSMGYFTDADLNYYYFMATQFGTSDRWFAPVMTRTQLNRAFIYAATSQGHVYPQNPNVPADANPYNAETILQALQNAGISWKVYLDPSGLSWLSAGSNQGQACSSFTGSEYNQCLAQNSYINEFTYESTIQNTPTLAQNFQPISQFATDVANQTLPQVAVIEPPSNAGYDEHPSDDDQYLENIQDGANWVEYNVINTLMWSNPNSPGGTPSASWHDSALIFTYDEPGGFYDHVQPQPVPAPNSSAGDSPYPTDLQAGDMCDGANQSTGVCSFAMTGYRIPLIVVSPYAKKNFVSHVVRDTTAWLNFVEERFGVPALNSRDGYWSTAAAGTNPPATMDEFFDYSNPPWMTPPTPPGQNTGGACNDDAPNPF